MLVIYYYGFFLKDYTNRNVIRVDIDNYTYEDVLMFSKDLEQQRHTLYVQFDKQFIDDLLEKNFNDVVFVYPSKDIKNEWLIRLQNENESLFRYVESIFDEDIEYIENIAPPKSIKILKYPFRENEIVDRISDISELSYYTSNSSQCLYKIL